MSWLEFSGEMCLDTSNNQVLETFITIVLLLEIILFPSTPLTISPMLTLFVCLYHSGYRTVIGIYMIKWKRNILFNKLSQCQSTSTRLAFSENWRRVTLFESPETIDHKARPREPLKVSENIGRHRDWSPFSQWLSVPWVKNLSLFHGFVLLHVPLLNLSIFTSL